MTTIIFNFATNASKLTMLKSSVTKLQSSLSLHAYDYPVS